jgi:hypothetical protein
MRGVGSVAPAAACQSASLDVAGVALPLRLDPVRLLFARHAGAALLRVGQHVFAGALAGALAAPTTRLARLHVAMIGVRMAAGALVSGASKSTPGVLPIGHRLQVRGVDARRVPAQMVEVQPFGDRPNAVFVDSSVRSNGTPIVRQSDLPVATAAGSSPFPAVRFGSDFVEAA